jgi:phosphomannomutase
MLQKSCNIFLATDPDADRLGAVVNHKDEAVILTGNQIAALLAEWILLRLKEQDKMPAHPTLVKTIVTSPLIEKIAREYGASIAEVLTGFKYIAQKMNEWEKDPDHQFIFGCEESYGYLYGTYARDKDGILCGCLLAEIAWYFKRKGKTLVDALEDLWKRYGYFEESTSTCIFSETKSGRDKMAEVMKSLRTKPPETFGEYKCILFEDLLTKQFKGDPKLRVGESLPQSDVLIFTLEGNSKIIVRPSGTEPKVKIYYMLTAATEGQDLTQVKIATKNKSDQLKRIMKDIVG